MIKQLLPFIAMLCIASSTYAQVKIGTNAATINQNSVLELESSDKGLLLPRLTTAQINGMSGVPAGMILFNITDSSIYIKRDTGWAIVPVAANAASKTVYWGNKNGNTYNTNSGNVGIGTDTPKAKLHVAGNDGMIATGAFGQGNDLAETGAGSKLIWYPKKAGFRAGYISTNNWHKDSIGQYSFAAGFETRAKGLGSSAFGYGAVATGDHSFSAGLYTQTKGKAAAAFGSNVTASGSYSMAAGYMTTASGSSGSVALGNSSNALGSSSLAANWENTAAGDNSVALGAQNATKGFGSAVIGHQLRGKAVAGMVVGLYNDTTDVPDPYVSAEGDRIFQLGNGTSTARSNAVTVLKNGNVGVGMTDPQRKLEVNGDLVIDANNENPGSANYKNVLRFGNTTSENYDAAIGSTNTGSSNQGGLDFYTKGNKRMTIGRDGEVGIGVANPNSAHMLEVNGPVRISGNLRVKGSYGIIRNTNGAHLKYQVKPISINLVNMAAGNTVAIDFTWSETFYTTPAAYVGNITGGAGGWAEVVMSVFTPTATGGTLYIHNPGHTAASPNFTVNIVGIGQSD